MSIKAVVHISYYERSKHSGAGFNKKTAPETGTVCRICPFTRGNRRKLHLLADVRLLGDLRSRCFGSGCFRSLRCFRSSRLSFGRSLLFLGSSCGFALGYYHRSILDGIRRSLLAARTARLGLRFGSSGRRNAQRISFVEIDELDDAHVGSVTKTEPVFKMRV